MASRFLPYRQIDRFRSRFHPTCRFPLLLTILVIGLFFDFLLLVDTLIASDQNVKAEPRENSGVFP
jgi:hypothetical protein